MKSPALDPQETAMLPLDDGDDGGGGDDGDERVRCGYKMVSYPDGRRDPDEPRPRTSTGTVPPILCACCDDFPCFCLQPDRLCERGRFLVESLLRDGPSPELTVDLEQWALECRQEIAENRALCAADIPHNLLAAITSIIGADGPSDSTDPARQAACAGVTRRTIAEAKRWIAAGGLWRASDA